MIANGEAGTGLEYCLEDADRENPGQMAVTGAVAGCVSVTIRHMRACSVVSEEMW